MGRNWNWRICPALLSNGVHGFMLRGRDQPDRLTHHGAVYLTMLPFEEEADALEMQRYLRDGATVAEAFARMHARQDAAGEDRRRD